MVGYLHLLRQLGCDEILLRSEANAENRSARFCTSTRCDTYFCSGDHANILDTSGNGSHTRTSEMRVGRKTLPITTTSGNSSQWTCNGSKSNINALTTVLLTQSTTIRIQQILVKGRGNVNASRKGTDELLATNTIRCIGKTHWLDTETGYSAGVADTGASEAAGDIDLLLKCHLR